MLVYITKFGPLKIAFEDELKLKPFRDHSAASYEPGDPEPSVDQHTSGMQAAREDRHDL